MLRLGLEKMLIGRANCVFFQPRRLAGPSLATLDFSYKKLKTAQSVS
jgi:hypothetical protein